MTLRAGADGAGEVGDGRGVSPVSNKSYLRASEVESPKYSLDEVKAITHPGFGGPGRERYSLAI